MIKFEELKPGDIIRNLGYGNLMIVIEVQKDKAIAIRTVTVTNETEWVKVER